MNSGMKLNLITLGGLSPLKSFRIILLALFFFALSTPLFSQPAGEDAASEDAEGDGQVAAPVDDPREGALFGEYENPDRFLGIYNHRFRLQLGAGYSRLSPVILNEAGPSWLVNSVIKNVWNPNEPFAYNAYTPKNITVYPTFWGGEYSFRDQFQIRFRSESIAAAFDRNDPTYALIFSPRSNIYWASLFEGVRLLRYEEKTKTLEISYTHPFLSWLKVGPLVGIESYSEKNNFSFGSYTKNKSTVTDPNKETWTIGGFVDSRFKDEYLTPGIEARAKIFSWLEVKGTAVSIKRKGHFDLGGFQVVQIHKTDGSDDQLVPIYPFYQGHLTDTGYRTSAEATFRFCRFNATVGTSYQKMKRKYDSYYGRYLSEISDFQFKSFDDELGTPVGIGFGEMSKKHNHSKINTYVLLGVDFHSDFGIRRNRLSGRPVQTMGPPPEEQEEESDEKGLGNLEEGELERLGTGNYMDKMYNGMKRDFEESGAKFEEIENGLKALGISLEKKKNEYGETKAIKVKIDGDMSFATGSARLTQKAKEMVDHISEAMMAYPETKATIGGHTDSVGPKAYNLRLSQRRANSVKENLVKAHNVPEVRILWVKGFGDEQKLVNTMAAEPLNRRVEIELTPAYVPEVDQKKQQEREKAKADAAAASQASPANP